MCIRDSYNVKKRRYSSSNSTVYIIYYCICTYIIFSVILLLVIIKTLMGRVAFVSKSIEINVLLILKTKV